MNFQFVSQAIGDLEWEEPEGPAVTNDIFLISVYVTNFFVKIEDLWS